MDRQIDHCHWCGVCDLQVDHQLVMYFYKHAMHPVADPKGSPDRPRTTLNFGPYFLY